MAGEAILDTPKWYVIHTHPRQEDRADGNLKSLNIETLLPRIRERRQNPYTGAASYIGKFLFPRYIFARFVLSALHHKVKFTRGVHYLVTFDDLPAELDEEIITDIRSRMGRDGFVRLEEPLAAGDEVIIDDDRFRGIRGVFEREMNEAARVQVLLQAVSFQGRMVVDRELVKRAQGAAQSCRPAA
jgi:transcriptional antiterminator RfaH